MDSEKGKVFVGGISFQTTEARLKSYFTTFGEVVAEVIIRDRLTGRSRGFGFVVFADPAVAEGLLLNSKHNIDGRMVEVKRAKFRDSRSRDNSVGNGVQNLSRTKKIFIGGFLAPTVTENDIREYFEQFGTITHAVVIYDPRTRRPRGFGFVTFESEDVVDAVVQKPIHELKGKMVEVKRAVPKERHIRFPAGRGGNFGARNGQFFNSTPTPVGGYAPPINNRYNGALGGAGSYSSYGPAGYNPSSFGSGAEHGPAIARGGYGSNTTFVSNIPSYGPGNATITGRSYGVPVVYGAGNAGNLGLYGNDDRIMLGAPANAHGNTISSVGYGGPTTGNARSISFHGAAQANNGQSNGRNVGYAAENNGYGTQADNGQSNGRNVGYAAQNNGYGTQADNGQSNGRNVGYAAQNNGYGTQADNGQSNGRNVGYAAQNNGYGMGVTYAYA